MTLNAKNAATMERYYEHTNTGDFPGAIQFLSDDVIYRIPGPPQIVPYAGDWVGKERVSLLFEAFNASFGLVDMEEVRTISTENEIFSLNDEIFTARTTGRPWRVGVLHHMTFNKDGAISGLDNYTDMVPAIQALAGTHAVALPVASTERVIGEEQISSAQAQSVVEQYYAAFPHVGLLLDEQVSALMPGDPRRLRFSGIWRGSNEFLRMTQSFAKTLDLQEQRVRQIVANNGAVMAIVHVRGTFIATKAPVELDMVDFFEIAGNGRIGRLTAFLDTYMITHSA